MEEKKEIKKNKIKLGILGCFYNCHEDMDKKLNPWFNRVESSKDFVFSFISAHFKEYYELGIKQDNTETEKALRFLKDNGLIQYLEVSDEPLMESEARNLALKPLLDSNCDVILLLDGDEFYNDEQVHNLLFFLNQEENQYYDWLSIPMKNYIFSGNEWIDGFCPPRLFKVKNSNGLILDKFFFDNDIYYKTPSGGTIDYRQLTNKSIPKDLLCGGIKHMTWLHSNGKNKVEYQNKHFNGICSYRFNEEKQELEFNPEYYKDKPYPVVNKD